MSEEIFGGARYEARLWTLSRAEGDPIVRQSGTRGPARMGGPSQTTSYGPRKR